jgi:tetratricopeptide (TPR) repeat protein
MSGNILHPESGKAGDAEPEGKAQNGPNGIGGWLSFFCAGLIFLGPLSSLVRMMASWLEAKPVFDQIPSLKPAVVFENVGIAAVLIYGIVAGCIVVSGSPSGRKIAKQYLLIRLFGFIGIELIVILMMADLPSNAFKFVVKSIAGGVFYEVFFFLAWWFYFKMSKRVRNTYGNEDSPLFGMAVAPKDPAKPARESATFLPHARQPALDQEKESFPLFDERITALPVAADTPSSVAEWHVIHEGKELGPLSLAALGDKAVAGEIDANDLVKQTGGLWTKARDFGFLQQQCLIKHPGEEEKPNSLLEAAKFGAALVIGVCVVLALVMFVIAWAHSRPTNPTAFPGLEAEAQAPSRDALHRGCVSMNRDHDYDKAIREFDEAIRLKPKYAEAFSQRGNAWSRKNDYDKAIIDFNEAIRLDPNDASYYFSRGVAWRNKKDYYKAIRDYDEAIRLDPNNALCYFDISWLLATCPEEKVRDGNRAIQLARRACELTDWKNGWELNGLAAAYAEAGKFHLAEFYQRKALDNPAYPGPPRGESLQLLELYQQRIPYRENLSAAAGLNVPKLVHTRHAFQPPGRQGTPALEISRGVVDSKPEAKAPWKGGFFYSRRAWDALNIGDYNNAIKDFDEAIRLIPNLAGAFYGRGNAWSAKNEYDRAIRDYDEAIRLDPNDALNYSKRGFAWLAKGDHSNAISDYNEAIRRDPTNAGYFHLRGFLWAAKKEYAKAMQDVNEAIRLDPNAANAYDLRGNIWSDKKDYQNAINDYDAAIRLNQKQESAYYNRGNAWSAQGNLNKAIGDYDEVIRINPSFYPAYMSRGIAWYRKNDYDKSIRDFSEAIRLDHPELADAYRFRGDAWLKKRDYDSAIKDYGEAIGFKANNASLHLQRGYAWSLKKDYTKAIRDYDEAIRLDPNNALAYSSRGSAWYNLRNFPMAKLDFDEASRLDPKAFPR